VSAVIIPFKDCDTGISRPQAGKRNRTKASVSPVNPRSLTKDDEHALRALMPTLTGNWLCEVGGDEDRNAIAFLACKEWDRWQFFIVLREDKKLCLLISCWPPSSELVEVYDDIEQLVAAIGNVTGCRDGALNDD
jgi:hypothetical protein